MNKSHSERGQSIVIIALMMIAFMAILALILDGGYSYTKRRSAQNAADAAALAGAEAYCRGYDVSVAQAEADARAAAQTYVIKNMKPADVYTYTIGVGSFVVTVRTNISYKSFFAQFIGYDTLQVSANAKAGCVLPGGGMGVLPIAWSCTPPATIPVSGQCSLEYEKHDCNWDPANPNNHDNRYIVVSSDTTTDDTICATPPTGCTAGSNWYASDTSGYPNCDVNDDCINDITILSGGNRSWLDLNGGGGTIPTEWICDGFPGVVRRHTWYAGKTGTDTSVYHDIDSCQYDKKVIVPVFDEFCHSGVTPDIACPSLYHTGVDTVVPETAAVDYFHITSFAIFHVACVGSPSSPCPARDVLISQGEISNSEKTVEGCFVQGDVGDIVGTPGQGVYSGVWKVYLMP